MRTKSHYRKFRDGGAVTADTPPVPPVAIIDIDRNDTAADDASAAFLRQIDALRKSEQIAKDRAAQMAAPPPQLSRAETIRRWQQNGLSDPQATFLGANPEMVDNPNALEAATRQAHIAGHQADSQEYFDSVKSYFHKHMNPPVAEPEYQPTKFSTPATETELLSSMPVRGSLYSAPVNRETASTGYSGGDGPGSVRLTVAMKEAAWIAGISEREYAEQVLRLREEKSQGHHGGQP
jgi:hypothetical protein